MNPHWRSIRLLQRAVHLWLFGYLLSAFSASEKIWEYPVVQPLPAPPGFLSPLTHAFNTWLSPELVTPLVLILLVSSARGVFSRSYWWITLVEWVLFSSLVNQAWLASNGGHQLMGNVLFWMIFLPSKEPEEAVTGTMAPTWMLHAAAFWMIRSQLLLAYAVTGIQKLTGDHWLAGDAVAIVATDADYGPVWIAAFPWLALLVNYGVLFFQLTFPLAVWWRTTRVWWMWMGVAFHLATGITFGILDMGLAFLAVYPIWFEAGQRDRRLPVDTTR